MTAVNEAIVCAGTIIFLLLAIAAGTKGHMDRESPRPPRGLNGQIAASGFRRFKGAIKKSSD